MSATWPLTRMLGVAMTFALLAVILTSAKSQKQPTAELNSTQEAERNRPSLLLTVQVSDGGGSQIYFDFDVDPKGLPALREALSAALRCPLTDEELSGEAGNPISELYALCNIPLHNHGLSRQGEVNLRPIEAILNGTDKTLLVKITLPQHGAVHWDPGPEQRSASAAATSCVYRRSGGAPANADLIRFSFGYSAGRLGRICAILGFLLLLPIATALWLRRKALHAPEEARVAVCFTYFRFLRLGALGGALIWWSAIDMLHMDDVLAFVLPAAIANDSVIVTFLPWILIWYFPALIYFACLILSAPIHALRGTVRTKRQIVRQSFWTVARFVLPLSLLTLAIAEIFSSPRIAVFLFVATVVVSMTSQRALARAYGLELHGLTTGELRDRAFAIAEKAGAKLQQLYVLPTEHMRMANAFAHVRSNIFLTDYLLNNLNKREVDAIIAHEVTHLQKKHIRQRLTAFFAFLLVFGFVGAFAEDRIPAGFPSGPVVYALILLVVFFVSRRNEFSADAGAVQLTGDTEAMITGLAKISRLNTMPIHWSKLDEKMITHPSTLKRMERLARAGGISQARIPELLEQSLAAPTNVYSVPSTALPSGKVFSTQFKGRLALRLMWSILLSMAALPALVAFVAQWASLHGWSLWTAYSFGLLLTLGAGLILTNLLPLRGLPNLEKMLRAKLENEGAPTKVIGGQFVSLAPDSSPRVYEGNWAWDVGFLSLSAECLTYAGEEARFSLRREEILHISLGPGPISWFHTPSAYIQWRDSTVNREGVFNVRPLHVRSMRQMGSATRALVSDLERWHQGLPTRSDSILATVPMAAGPAESSSAPGFGQVTSIAPTRLVRGAFLARDFLLNTFIATGMAVLFGLRFPILDSISPSADSTALRATGGGFLYLLAVVWISRAFMLRPFWRFRETAARFSAPNAFPISNRSTRR
jgi:Zn-dependent protease with chaperone function